MELSHLNGKNKDASKVGHPIVPYFLLLIEQILHFFEEADGGGLVFDGQRHGELID